MKFKAVMVNDGSSAGGGGNQSMVLHVLQALQRLERALERRQCKGGPPASVVLKLTPDMFVLGHRGGTDEGSQTWCHFTTSELFSEYRIESKRQNQIDLEAPIANLLHVFNSCNSSDRTTVRLSNGADGRPILGFEFALPGNVADHRVEQDVPVRVIPEEEAKTIKEPFLPEPEFQIELPSNLFKIKNVLDRMRAVGAAHLLVEALLERPAGAAAPAPASGASPGSQPVARASLKFVAEVELATISTTFPSLHLVMTGKKIAPPEGPVRLFLSLRRLAEVLAAIQGVNAMCHVACLLENRTLVLYAMLPKNLGSVISYTPAVDVG